MAEGLPVVGVQLVAAGLTGFENTLNQANRAASNFASDVNSSISNIGRGRSTSFVTQIENDFNRLNKLSSGGLRLNFVDQIASQLDAATGKMATGIKGTSGITSWMQTIQNDVNRMGGIKLPETVLEGFGKGFGDLGKSAQQAATVVADSGQKAASATVQSADKIAIAQARVETAQTKAATASAVGANQIAASGSKAALAAAQTSSGITIANNRVVSSYVAMGASIVRAISDVVVSLNRMVVSIFTTVSTIASGITNAVSRIVGGIGSALGGAAGGIGGAIGSSISGLNKLLQGTSSSANSLASSSSNASRGIRDIGNAAESTRNPLTFLQNTLSVGLGNAAAMAAASIVSTLKEAGTAWLSATSQYQYQQVGLIGLIQREMTRMGSTTEEALGVATVQAGFLMNELSDIAILSPYLMKDVQQVFKLSMAFGQTADGARQFTKNILDIAAGTGASNDMLERMAYNFSQIRLQGKITWLDWRQLAMAGFDLGEVVKFTGEQVGIVLKTDEDFNAAMQQGIITWKNFDDALTQVADVRFKGAAERMARTLFGLKNNIDDFYNLTVPKLFMPAADEFAARANLLFNGFIQFRESGVLEALGSMTGEWVGTTMDAIGGMKDRVGSFFGDVIDAAYDWGGSLIINFAAGIIGNVQWAISSAMGVLSNAISYWLAPGSPPNVAPNLAIWGAAALDEWLGGFKDADWDLFDAITKPLRSILDLFGETTFTSIGARIAQALSDISVSGFTNIDIIAEVTAATREFGKSMADLVNLQLQYTASSKLVEDADKRITAGESKQAALVREYNKMRKAGASPAMLRAKGLEIEATKDEIYLAKKQKLDEEAKLELLKKQLDLQERLINALIDFAKQEEQYRKDAEAARKKAEADAKKETTGADGTPAPYGLSDFAKNIGKDIDAIKKKFLAEWYAMLKPLTPLRKAWDLFTATMANGVSYLRSQLLLLWANMQTGLAMLNPGLARLALWWSSDGWKITDSARKFGDQIFWLAGIILQTLGKAWMAVWPFIVKGFDILVNWIFNNGDRVEGVFKKWYDFIQKIGEYIAVKFSPILISVVELIATRMLKNIDLLLIVLDGLLLLLGGDWKGAWALWSKAGEGAIQGIRDSINGAWAAFSGWWNGTDGKTSGKEQLAATWTSITDSLGGALSGAWTWFTKWWDDNKTGEKLVALWENVTTSLGNALSSAWTAFSNWWTTAPPGGKTGQQTLIEIAEGIGDGIYDALVGAWKNLKTWYDANQAEMWAGIWNVAIDLLVKLIVPALGAALQLAWDGFVSLAKVIPIKFSLFETPESPKVPLGEFGEPPTPGGFKFPDWYVKLFGVDDATLKRLGISTKSMRETWSGAWDAMNLNSKTATSSIASDYNQMYVDLGATNYTMMPVQQTAWSTFWNGLGFSFSTWSTGISSTWDTMWSNVENFFVTRRVALYLAWQNFWSSVTLLWNDWTGGIAGKWWRFWDDLRDKLNIWKDANWYWLWNTGKNIMQSIIDGLVYAVATMSNIGSALVNAIWNQILARFGFSNSVSGMATGGIVQSPKITRVGEGGKSEAIIPLESMSGIYALARALNQASIMQGQLNPIVMPFSRAGISSGGGSVYNQNLYVNTVQPAVNVLQSYESMRAYYGTY
jgi:tape measure domain-containing protein